MTISNLYVKIYTEVSNKMKPKFKEDKTTQAAAIFLKLAAKEMPYIKLLKLLYILDRKALLSWSRPITYDSYVSMDRGPVLSKTYVLITEETGPSEYSYWRKYISEPEHFSVKLIQECPDDLLSEAEIELIHQVFEQFGRMDKWALVDLTHAFPEWKDPKGSAIPISYSDILKAEHKSEEEIKIIENELESIIAMDRYL